MFEPIKADISILENLQIQANSTMGLSPLSVFNDDDLQNAQFNKTKLAKTIGKAAIITAMTISALGGKMSMPPTTKMNPMDRPKIVTKNAAKRRTKQT